MGSKVAAFADRGQDHARIGADPTQGALNVERITISLDEALAQEFDALIGRRGYVNRSEAVRDMIRQLIETDRIAQEKASHCVASVSYVYNHHERQLATRIVELQHEHHDLTVASMHAHLDHEYGIESVLLRGPTESIQAYANRLLAERGVRHGAVNLIPVDGEANKHSHSRGTYRRAHTHTHFRPKT